MKRIILLLVVLLLSGCNLADQQPATKDTPKLLEEVRAIVKKTSIYDVSDKDLTIGAVKGMVEAQKDPYSHFFSKEETILQKHRLAKERIGLGMKITQQGNRFIITELVPGTSAADQLAVGDEILAVNGQSVTQISTEELIQLLAGKEGTDVALKVFSKQQQVIQEVHVRRMKIPQTTLTHYFLNDQDNKYLYVRISVFGESTTDEWQKLWKGIQISDVQGVILDVRDNPGGYLGSVVPIAETFVPQETPLLWMENAKGELHVIQGQNEQPIAAPVVVLQNKMSASASEVLLASLLETDRAISIGTTTFGKGTVQETFDFDNGSSLKVSTNRWLTPRKTWIHGKGIEPTIEIQYPEPEELQLPENEEQWLKVKEAFSKLSSDSVTDKNLNQTILAFQRKHHLPMNGSLDAPTLLELKVRYREWLSKPEHDEAIQLALDYFQHNN
ncbi:S41 family peptidase [Chryseomicrobium palamuruense]|uniref:S41 family peptidase n=1 Tax=Chryseomicrobium palamuruense TaxID=682973 RepID=A0ABV8US68_9BACL